jgi:hypothetical protein
MPRALKNRARPTLRNNIFSEFKVLSTFIANSSVVSCADAAPSRSRDRKMTIPVSRASLVMFRIIAGLWTLALCVCVGLTAAGSLGQTLYHPPTAPRVTPRAGGIPPASPGIVVPPGARLGTPPVGRVVYDDGKTEAELRRAWTARFRELQPNHRFKE